MSKCIDAREGRRQVPFFGLNDISAVAPISSSPVCTSPYGQHAAPLIPRLILVLAGLAFVGVSAAVNWQYGVMSVEDPVLAKTWGALAVAVSVAAALLMPAAHSALGSRDYGKALMCVAGAILFAGYSLSCALGAASGGRTDAALLETDVAGKRTRAQASYDKAQSELAGMPVTRTVTELRAAIEPLTAKIDGADCLGWVRDKAARTACAERHGAQQELARAQRRVQLEGEMAAARTVLDTAGPAKAANSDAASIVHILSLTGLVVGAEDVNLYLSIFRALVVELGGGVCFTAASVGSRGSREMVAPLPLATASSGSDAARVLPRADNVIPLRRAIERPATTTATTTSDNPATTR